VIIPAKRLWATALSAALVAAACASGATPGPTGGPTTAPLTGEIRIDGSSTVYPVTEAVAEEFQRANSGVRVTVAFSGTGGGFKKFCAEETDANDASRPIKVKEELEALCKPAGVEPVELKVAIDGLSVVVNPRNTWATCMTTAELKKLWNEGSTVQRWNEIRPEWPNERIVLFGPGADSGTFDYFTEVINGTAQKSRSDFTQSEDDNALVTGVAGDQYALGYFGYAYYEENPGKLKALEIDGGKGCVAPTNTTINDGTYAPLSRPLFVYPSRKSLERPEVAAFFRYYLDTVDSLLDDVGYIKLPAAQLQASKDALEAALK
jgi:phosphate transport system substrate-binding protein